MKISKYMPEVICSLPWDVQRLIWIAFHYQHRIGAHCKSYWWSGDEGNVEKLDKYVHAYERVKELIKKLCARRGIEEICVVESEGIIVEEVF
ncbi:MAG: hypothetical protein J7L31_06175 [Thermoplasmata archaeon]|nr:hypothetical protein [Thermoplasmata archaeon]